MKKYFLFIFVFLGIFSPVAKAGGCNAQICMCPNGGYVSTNQYCPAVQESQPLFVKVPIGVIAVDPDTGKWASVSDTTDKKAAKADAMTRCGANCKIFIVDPGRCVGAAYSKEDKVLAFDSATSTVGIGFNTRIERSNEKALKKCEKSGGQSCKILVNVCAVGGATKY